MQAALQQQVTPQFLAPQFAAQPFAFQYPLGTNAFNGQAPGTAQPVVGWQPPQVTPEQFSPALQYQSQQHLLQRLAQYHYLVAQQLAQFAAQQTAQNSGYAYTGQFIPAPLGANFGPGITTH